MNKATETFKWIIRNFFPITIAIFIIIYLRWFRLTPLMFFNDPDGAYIVGLILLGLYVLSGSLLRLSKNHSVLRIILFIPTSLLLIGSIIHAIAFFPTIETTTKCNGNTYYITWMHPFGDYQWSFCNVTIWKGSFDYKSFFFGYSGGAYKVICDQEKNEANIIDISNNILVYTDGETPRHYDQYAGTQLGNHLYFVSYDWFWPDGYNDCDWTCEVYTYRLFECNLDYKSCVPLPIQFTSDYDGTLVLEANEKTNEISLYDDYKDNLDRTLFFTYGEHSRCYVEGCLILEK